jgi:hypothetical protein
VVLPRIASHSLHLTCLLTPCTKPFAHTHTVHHTHSLADRVFFAFLVVVFISLGGTPDYDDTSTKDWVVYIFNLASTALSLWALVCLAAMPCTRWAVRSNMVFFMVYAVWAVIGVILLCALDAAQYVPFAVAFGAEAVVAVIGALCCRHRIRVVRERALAKFEAAAAAQAGTVVLPAYMTPV